MMTLTAIAALDAKGAIGKNGGLLASLKEDMAHFRRTTSGHTVVMGRKTLESYPGKKPLPKRRNIVLSRDASLQIEGAEVVNDIDSLFDALIGEEEVFVLGGGEIYSVLLPYCKKLILTEIDADLNGEVFFPSFDKSEWASSQLGEDICENGLNYRFMIYEKKEG